MLGGALPAGPSGVACVTTAGAASNGKLVSVIMAGRAYRRRVPWGKEHHFLLVPRPTYGQSASRS